MKEQFGRLFRLPAILFAVVITWTILSLDSISLSQYEAGKSKYKELELYATNENYGKCWINAVEVIKVGCREFTEETHARMALAYLNCFLEMQGRHGYICSQSDSVHSCTERLSDTDRSNYATFFTHTHSICYFLQSQVWHEKTQKTINRLSLNSEQVADQLEESSRLQLEVIERQNQSLKNQETILDQTNNLSQIINSSSENIHEMLSDFQKTSTEQRIIINALFNRVSQVQALVIGEMSTIYSLVYYISIILILYFLTSTKRTSEARLWLFGMMTISMVIEWFLVVYVLKTKEGVQSFQEQADSEAFQYKIIWYWRKFTAVLGVCILVYKAYRYKDIQEFNSQQLQDLRSQFTNFRKVLEELVSKTSEKESKKSKGEHNAESTGDNLVVSIPTQETSRQIVTIPVEQIPERRHSPKKGCIDKQSQSESGSDRSRRSRSRRSLERELRALQESSPSETKQDLLKNWTKSGYYQSQHPALEEDRELQDVHSGQEKSKRSASPSTHSKTAVDNLLADDSSDISLRITKGPYSLRSRKRNNTAS